MSLTLIIILAVITYASRVLALAVLPPPSRSLEGILNRVPGPLFAGLAALSLVGPGANIADGSVLLATAGALVAAPSRSLLVVLVAGLAGYWLARAVM
jgi:branched-subunit amino acid transport protein